MRYNARMAETFADRRRLLARRQRRYLAVIGPCLIAAFASLALGVGARVRQIPFPLSAALLLCGLAVCLAPFDLDRPAPKLILFAALCAIVVTILVGL